MSKERNLDYYFDPRNMYNDDDEEYDPDEDEPDEYTCSPDAFVDGVRPDFSRVFVDDEDGLDEFLDGICWDCPNATDEYPDCKDDCEKCQEYIKENQI